jgi:signal transduction histidine kinase
VIREDVRRDHMTLGRTLAAVLPDMFRDDGEARALALLNVADRHKSEARMRWLLLDGQGRAELEAMGLDLERLAAGQEAWLVRDDGDADTLVTFVPVRLHDGRLGAIELSELLASERAQVQATILRTALATLVIAVIAGLITTLLGVWLVGRPVAALSAKARRVGSGDLSGPLHFDRDDELSCLAQEMNAMCERLDTALRARQAALEQLRHVDRLSTIGRLAAGVAHELGTPLNVVGLEAKRIARGKALGEAATQAARTIGEQADRMTRIISQLLDFARRRPLRTVVIDLADVVTETATLLEPLAARSKVTLVQSAIRSALVDADRAQLQQVLANLVVNAVQSMPSGGVVELETGHGLPPNAADAAPSMAFARVCDTGGGIAPEQLVQIFEPFFTTKDVGQGTGLGLAVAHGIIEEHGGTITVQSELGRGSCFTVWLKGARRA